MEGITGRSIFLLGDSSLLTADAALSSTASLAADAVVVRYASVDGLSSTVNVEAAGGRDAFGSSTMSARLDALASAREIVFAEAAVAADVSMSEPSEPFEVYRAVAAEAALSCSTNVPAVTAEPVLRLHLPTSTATFTSHFLFGRFPVTVGVSLLITDGVARLVASPSDIEVKAADEAYLGGYKYQVTPAQRDVIVGVGYGDLIEEA